MKYTGGSRLDKSSMARFNSFSTASSRTVLDFAAFGAASGFAAALRFCCGAAASESVRVTVRENAMMDFMMPSQVYRENHLECGDLSPLLPQLQPKAATSRRTPNQILSLLVDS